MDNRVPTPIIENDSVDDNTLPMILPGEAQIIELLQIETGLLSELPTGFGGAKMFDSYREQLPFLTEPGAPVAIWKIISGFIG